jgi:ATP-binding cassette, subfamily B, bacterial PglK
MNAFSVKMQKLKPLFLSLSLRRRRQLLLLQILSLVAAAGEVANLGALLPVLRLLANPSEGLKSLGPIATPLRTLPETYLLLVMGLVFLLVVCLSTTLRVITIRFQLRLTALIAADLGQQVFINVMQRPYSWHLQQNSSKVIGFLTKDVDQVKESIQALLSALVNVAIVLILGSTLIALAPGLMLLVATMLGVFYILVFRFTRAQLKSDGEKLTKNYQLSLQLVQEALGGIRDVILDRSQPFFLEAYRGNNTIYRLAAAEINTKAQIPRYLIEGFTIVLLVMLSLVLAFQGQSIEDQLPILGTLALGAYRLLQPIQQCFGALSISQANQASLSRLNPFLGKSGVVASENSKLLLRLPAPIDGVPMVHLEKLSFRYSSEGPWILRDMELKIQSGERIAFVGTSGSGKSTTSDLILGLLEPSQGRLLVHGQDLFSTAGLLRYWQQHVAYVPQSIYLSDASFASNIAFGIPSSQINQHLVREVAKQAQIAELIETSKDGYSTVIGERGVLLSGGQKQRIGLARALYKQAELLVLDEATSALDVNTEAMVMETIDSLASDLTIVVIAHRLETTKACDRIIDFSQFA